MGRSNYFIAPLLLVLSLFIIVSCGERNDGGAAVEETEPLRSEERPSEPQDLQEPQDTAEPESTAAPVSEEVPAGEAAVPTVVETPSRAVRAPEVQPAVVTERVQPQTEVSLALASPTNLSYYTPEVRVAGSLNGALSGEDLLWEVLGTELQGTCQPDNRGNFDFSFSTRSVAGDITLAVRTVDTGPRMKEAILILQDPPGGPVIRLNTPVSGDTYRSEVKVQGQVSDHRDAVGKAEGIEGLEYRIAGTDRAGSLSFDASGRFSSTLNTSGLQGPLVLELKARDYRGRLTTAAVSLSAEGSGPALTILEPADNSFYRSVMKVRGLVSDSSESPESTAEIDRLQWRIEGTDRKGNVPFTSAGSFSFDLDTLDLPKQIVLTLFAVDKNGHLGERKIYLRDDGEGPFIDLRSPVDGQTYGETITLSGRVLNRQGSPSPEGEVASLTWQFVEESADPEPLPFASNGAFALEVPPPEAGTDLTLELIAVDNHGHRTAEIVRLQSPALPQGRAAPEKLIDLQVPREAEYRSSARIAGRVFGAASSEAGRVSWNIRGTDRRGTVIVEPSGSFTMEIDTRGLSGRLAMTLQTEGRNEKVAKTVMLNESPLLPFLTLESPTDGSVYRSSFTLRGTVSDRPDRQSLAELKELTWKIAGTEQGGLLRPDERGYFNLEITTQGMREDLFLQVAAEDLNGRVTEKMVTLKDDGVGPYIRFLSPENGGFYPVSVECRGHVWDSPETSESIKEVGAVSWSVGETNLGGTLFPDKEGAFSFSFSGIGLPETAVVRVTAKDKNGHESVETLTLRRDPEGPMLTVESPKDLGYYTGDVRVAGRVRDREAGPVTLTELKTLSWRQEGAENNGGYVYVEPDGRFNFSVDTGKLQGPLQLILKADDVFGNVTEKTVRLQDGKIPPVIEVESPEEDSFYGVGILLKGKVVDPYGRDPVYGGIDRLEYEVVSAQFSRDQEKISGTLRPNPDGGFSRTVNTSNLRDDQHLILKAYGTNGNRSEKVLLLRKGDSAFPSFRVSPGNEIAEVTWNTLPFVDSYSLRYAPGGPEALSGGGVEMRNLTPPVILPRLENGTRYSLVLEGSLEGRRVPSAILECIPLADGTLKPRATGGFEQITLEWNAIPGTDRFVVSRALGTPDAFLPLEIVQGTGCIDTSARYGVEYFYRIAPEGILAPEGGYTKASCLEAPNRRLSSISLDSGVFPTSVRVMGDYAYLALGSRGLRIIDISDPPRSKERGTFAGGDTRDVAVQGDFAYLADGEKGVKVVNIADPRNPYLVGARNTQNAQAIAVRNEYVFLADGPGGLRILDVRNPGSPERLAAFELDDAVDCLLDRNIVYVASGIQGLKALDISSPQRPAEMGSFPAPRPLKLHLADGRLYVADGKEGLLILDISDPARMIKLGSFPLAGLKDLDLVGQYAFLAAEQGLVVVDVLDPRNPVKVDDFPASGALSLGVKDDFVFLSESGGFRLLRAYLIGKSFRIAECTLPGTASHITLSGNTAVVAAGISGFHLVNVGNPVRLRNSDVLRTLPAGYAEGSLISQGYLVLSDWEEGIKVYPQPWNDKPLFHIPLTPSADMAAQDNLLISAMRAEGLSLLDLSPLQRREEPRLLDRWNGGDIRAVAAEGDLAAAADRTSGLLLFSLGEKKLVKLGEYPVPGIRDVSLSGSLAAVVGSEGVTFLDISNPAKPVQKGFYPTRFGEKAVYSGDYLYLAEGYRGLTVLTLSEQGRCSRLTTCPKVYAVDCAVIGDYVLVSGGSGLSVVKVVFPNPDMK